MSAFEHGIAVYDVELELKYQLKNSALKTMYDVTVVDITSRVLVIASSVGLKQAKHKSNDSLSKANWFANFCSSLLQRTSACLKKCGLTDRKKYSTRVLRLTRLRWSSSQQIRATELLVRVTPR